MLTWPVRRAARWGVTLASGGDARPSWRSFTDLATLSIVPCKILCPAQSATLSEVMDVGIVCQNEEAMGLFEYQALNGFAGATEQALMDAHGLHGLELPPVEVLALGPEEALATSLICALRPGVSEEAVIASLEKKALWDEKGHYCFDDNVDIDCFDDVAERKDRQSARELQNEAKQARAQKTASLASAKKVVNGFFKGKKTVKKSKVEGT